MVEDAADAATQSNFPSGEDRIMKDDQPTANVHFIHSDQAHFFSPSVRSDASRRCGRRDHHTGARDRWQHRDLPSGQRRPAACVGFQVLWTSQDDFNHHVQRFTRKTLVGLVEGVGLETVAMRYFFFWTCPVKLLVRFKERVFRSPSERAGVPAAMVNRALYRLSRLEETSIGRLPMPFGSSLLFVGRRVSQRTAQ